MKLVFTIKNQVESDDRSVGWCNGVIIGMITADGADTRGRRRAGACLPQEEQRSLSISHHTIPDTRLCEYYERQIRTMTDVCENHVHCD